MLDPLKELFEKVRVQRILKISIWHKILQQRWFCITWIRLLSLSVSLGRPFAIGSYPSRFNIINFLIKIWYGTSFGVTSTTLWLLRTLHPLGLTGGLKAFLKICIIQKLFWSSLLRNMYIYCTHEQGCLYQKCPFIAPESMVVVLGEFHGPHL